MPISPTPLNLIEFFAYLSPILISSFLVFQSFFNWDVKAMVWLVGTLLTWIVGMMVKFTFHSIDDSTIQKALTQNPRPNPMPTRKFQRPAIIQDSRTRGRNGIRNIPDYCSVFSGPYGTHAVYNTSMPSLDAMFHAFTLAYIGASVSQNPNNPTNGIAFLIFLALVSATNLLFRINHSCDKALDVVLGLILGAACGVGYYFAVVSTNPTWTYYGKEKKGKCVLGTQKFRCTYNKT